MKRKGKSRRSLELAPIYQINIAFYLKNNKKLGRDAEQVDNLKTYELSRSLTPWVRQPLE